MFTYDAVKDIVEKWQPILSLKDWNIDIKMVEKEWRKSGDIKIDQDIKQAVLMINSFNPRIENLEALVVHELLHLKLWGMDQMIENLIRLLFGNDESDPKFQFAFRAFMEILEPTVEDLARAYIEVGAEDKTRCYGRVYSQVNEELS